MPNRERIMRYIERRKEFLEDYDNKTLTLKYLTQDIASTYRKEIAEYEARQTINTNGYATPRKRYAEGAY